jgi:hypothetical protein
MQFSDPVMIIYSTSPMVAALNIVLLMVLKSKNEGKMGWASLMYAAGAVLLSIAATTVVLSSNIIYNTPALLGCYFLILCSLLQAIHDLKSSA